MSADFVWNTSDGTFYNRRMRHQGAFYFKRADTVAGTLDNIVGTAHEPEVTVFITPGDIARVIQAVVPKTENRDRS